MCVGIYILLYVYVHIYVYVYLYIYIHTYIYIHIHTYTYIHTRTQSPKTNANRFCLLQRAAVHCRCTKEVEAALTKLSNASGTRDLNLTLNEPQVRILIADGPDPTC